MYGVYKKVYKTKTSFLDMAEVALPGYGGLQRFKEEYKSSLQFGPAVVVGMIIAVIVFVAGLRIFG